MSSKRKFEAQEQIEAEDEKIESSAKRIKNKNEEDVSDGKDEKKTEKNGKLSMFEEFADYYSSQGFIIPDKCKKKAADFVDTHGKAEVKTFNINKKMRQESWSALDFVREIIQNSIDAAKGTALENGCDYSGLRTIIEKDEDTTRYLFVCPLRKEYLSMLSDTAMKKANTKNGMDVDEKLMIVGIVEIKRLSADYISITTRNPAQVLDKACFNVAASTKSDDGVNVDIIDGKLFMSGFFGDGLKAGILALLRGITSSCQPHVVIYSNNERLQFSIAGNDKHYLYALTKHLSWRADEIDCLMYLADSYHTGNMVTVDTCNIPSWAFCERGFLFLADPRLVMQVTLYPSQFKVEYHEDSGLRRVAAPCAALTNTRPVLGRETQTIRDGGFIQVFREDMPFVVRGEEKKDKEKDKDKISRVLHSVSDCTYIRDLMLGEKGVVSICSYPGQGALKIKPVPLKDQDKQSELKVSFVPAEASKDTLLFDVVNLMHNPAGVERQMRGLTYKDLYDHLLKMMPPMPHKAISKGGPYEPWPLNNKEMFKVSKRARYTCMPTNKATQNDLVRFVYEQLWQWAAAYDKVQHLDKLDISGWVPDVQISTDLGPEALAYISQCGGKKPLELQVLEHEKPARMVAAFVSLFKAYYQRDKPCFPIEHNCSLANFCDYRMFSDKKYQLVACGPLILQVLRKGSQEYMDLPRLKEEKVNNMKPYLMTDRQMDYVRELHSNLSTLYGNRFTGIDIFTCEVAGGDFVIVLNDGGEWIEKNGVRNWFQRYNIKLASTFLDINKVHAQICEDNKCPNPTSKEGNCACQWVTLLSALETQSISPDVCHLAAQKLFKKLHKNKGKVDIDKIKEKEKKEQKKFADRNADSDGDDDMDGGESAKSKRAADRERKRLEKLAADKAQREREQKELEQKEKELKEKKKAMDKELKEKKEKEKAEIKLMLASAVQNATSGQYFNARAASSSEFNKMQTCMNMEAGGGVWTRDEGADQCCFPFIPPMYLITHIFDYIISISSDGCLSFHLTSDAADSKLVIITPTPADQLNSLGVSFQVFSLVQALPDSCFGDQQFSLMLPGLGFHLLQHRIEWETNDTEKDKDGSGAIISANFWSNSAEAAQRSKLCVSLAAGILLSAATVKNVRVIYQLAVPTSFFNSSDKVFKQPLASFARPEFKAPSKPMLASFATHLKPHVALLFAKSPELLLKMIPPARRTLDSCTIKDLGLVFRNAFTDKKAINASDYPLAAGASASDHAKAVLKFMGDMKGVCRHRSNLLGLLLQSQGIQIKVLQSPTHQFLAVFIAKHGWVRLEAGGGGTVVPPDKSRAGGSGRSSGPAPIRLSTAVLAQHLKAFADKNQVALKSLAKEDKEKEEDKDSDDESEEKGLSVPDSLALMLNNWQGTDVGSSPIGMEQNMTSHSTHFKFAVEWVASTLKTRAAQDRL